MKKIMFIGAGLLQSYVIKKAKEMGYTTICVDKNKDSIGFKYADYFKVIDIVEKEQCLDYAIKMDIDGVISAATDYGVLTASYISENLNLVGNSCEVCELIKNKFLVRKILTEKKIEFMENFYQIDCIEKLEKLKDKLIFPLIVKPCDGSGSRGVKKVDNFNDLKYACINAMTESSSKKAFIESFISGKEYGVESFVHKDDIDILLIMEKKMTSPPNYAELGHYSVSGLDDDMEAKIKLKVFNAIKSLGITTGAVNMDILITESQDIYIIDIGARMGGNLIGSHIVPLSTGIDHMKNIISECVGDYKNIDVTRKNFDDIIVTRILDLTPGDVNKVENMSDIYNYEYVNDVILNIGNKINEYKKNSDGCGYIVLKGNDICKIKKQSDKLKNIIDNKVLRY